MATKSTGVGGSTGGNSGGGKAPSPAPTKVVVRPPPGNVRGTGGGVGKKKR